MNELLRTCTDRVLCECPLKEIHCRDDSLESGRQNDTSVDDSQPLSQTTPILAQWVHKQNSHGGRDEVNKDIPSPRLAWLLLKKELS